MTFIQDACDLKSRPYKTVEFVVVDVSQVSGVELSGFYHIVCKYHVLNGIAIQKLYINEGKIFDATCVFLERGTFPEDTLISTTKKGSKYLQGFKKSFFVIVFSPTLTERNNATDVRIGFMKIVRTSSMKIRQKQ